MWYCAHAIFYFKCQQQDTFLLHENVYLIEADCADDASKKAECIARDNEDRNDDGHLEVNGVPAQYVFAGLRKLIEVELDPDTSQGRIHSGIEATYSVMEVDTLEEIASLASGQPTNVLYRE